MNERDFRGELVRLYSASFGWALCCCDQRREEAEEVLQTTYVKVLGKTARFDGRANLRTWLFAVIRRTASEQRRRRWLRDLALGRWLLHEPPPVHGPDQEAMARGSENGRALRSALAALPVRQRAVLHLVFYQDLTVEETSRVLGISLGTARTHFGRGKAKLRQILSAEGKP